MPNLFDILNSQIFWKLKVKHTHESQPRSTTAATLLAHISRDFKLADDMPTAQLVPGIHNKPCQPYRGTTFLSLDNKEL